MSGAVVVNALNRDRDNDRRFSAPVVAAESSVNDVSVLFRLAVLAHHADSMTSYKTFQDMTYLYETIPGAEGGEIRRYEIRQSIHDPALTLHPETGEPIRRVIVGGLGLITGKSARSRPVVHKPAPRGCGCGGGGCGH